MLADVSLLCLLIFVAVVSYVSISSLPPTSPPLLSTSFNRNYPLSQFRIEDPDEEHTLRLKSLLNFKKKKKKASAQDEKRKMVTR